MAQIIASKSLVQAFSVLPLLKSLDVYYPDFSHWYINTALPGVIAGNDVLLIAKERESVVGVALGKKATQETKLRCVRVVPQRQSTGLGIRLMDTMLEHLESDKPHCTVAQEMLDLYSRVFVRRYGFSLDDVQKGRYRKGKLEYCFNL